MGPFVLRAQVRVLLSPLVKKCSSGDAVVYKFRRCYYRRGVAFLANCGAFCLAFITTIISRFQFKGTSFRKF